MQSLTVELMGAIISTIGLCAATCGSELRQGELESELVPGPVEYAVLLPDGYVKATEPFPLLILLHGGGGSSQDLANQGRIFDELWTHESLPDLVVAMPSAKRSLYMNYKDASQQWEHFIMRFFLDHVRDEYNVARERAKTSIAGASMGGIGALRMAFKYPDQFGAVVAFEPAIMPVLTWSEVQPRNRFFRSDELLNEIYGQPFDASYWDDNNPASIAKRNAARIRESELQIYLECGDEDYLNLHEGAEFLHRILWDEQIKHEYHLVRRADHLGRTLERRFKEGYAFLDRVLDPPGPDPATQRLQRIFGEAKQKAESDSE